MILKGVIEIYKIGSIIILRLVLTVVVRVCQEMFCFLTALFLKTKNGYGAYWIKRNKVILKRIIEIYKIGSIIILRLVLTVVVRVCQEMF